MNSGIILGKENRLGCKQQYFTKGLGYFNPQLRYFPQSIIIDHLLFNYTGVAIKSLKEITKYV